MKSMDMICGRRIVEKIHESRSCMVFRGTAPGEDTGCILKVRPNTSDEPGANVLAHEFDMLQQFNHAGIVKARALQPLKDGMVLIQEDIRGISLEHICRHTGLTLSRILELSLEILGALKFVHAQKILHNNLCPDNIVVNLETGRVNIIDFRLARRIPVRTGTGTPGTAPPGNPAYLSPERTGRTRYPVDARSDLYSVGILLYRLVTGTPPFNSPDPAQLIHAHLARPVPEIKTAIRTLPASVSAIIMKLLEKIPDDRYPSAESVIRDLAACMEQTDARPGIHPDAADQKDHVTPLDFPQKLYGRQKEHRIILQAWQNLKQEKKQVVCVSGGTGVGKTALVQHIEIHGNQGIPVRGKFDQLRNNVPYRAVTQAFESFMDRILGSRQEEFEQWRETLKQALGPNGQLIIDIIPGLENIIGPQPPVPPLSPLKEKNRFAWVFHNFVQVLCTPEQPVFLFIDDLQWADIGSLDLIRTVFLSDSIAHLLFIGAYRDNEVTPGHPWIKLLQEIEAHQVPVTRVPVLPLSVNETTQLLAETLRRPPRAVARLSELTLKKTGGNPYFIREFLSSVHGRELLWFDHKSNAWQWDADRINTLSISDTVAGFIRERIDKLAPMTIHVLKTAACLGDRFNIHTLATGCGQTVKETLRALEPAVAQSIVILLGRPADPPGSDTPEEDDTIEYGFTHDSIQKSAYAMIPDTDKPGFHWQIGKELLARHEKNGLDKNLFAVVNQLNAGRVFLKAPDEHILLGTLNRDSGNKALDAAAYESAFDFFKTGIAVLATSPDADSAGPSPWSVDRDLSLSLHEGAAQAAFLLNEYEKMDTLIRSVDRNITDLLKKARLFEIKTSSLYARNRMNDAVNVAVEFAGKLGVTFPKTPTKRHIFLGLMETRLRLAGKTRKDLTRLPEMNHKESYAALEVLSNATLAAFFARPNLLPLIIFKSIKLSLRYGHTPASIFGYAGYGFILCGILNAMDRGYKFGKLALELMAQFQVKTIETRTYATFCAFIIHWKRHLRESIPILEQAHLTGLETGDHQFASSCAKVRCVAGFICGHNLESLKKTTRYYLGRIKQLKQDVMYNTGSIYMQAIFNLTGTSDTPWQVKGTAFDMDEMTPVLIRSQDFISLFTQYFLSAQLCFLFDQTDQAVNHADRAHQYFSASRGMSDTASFIFFDALIRLSLLPVVPKRRKRQLHRQIKADLKQIKTWAGYCPENNRHRLFLVRAEICKSKNRIKAAERYYRRSIDLAGRSGYLNDKAVAGELAGKFYLAIHDEVSAQAALSAAHASYLEWGATAKAHHMAQQYSRYLAATPAFPGAAPSGRYLQLDRQLIAQHNVDVYSVLKAARAIARETDYDTLMAKLIRLIIENSGAQRAFLLLYSDQTLNIEAYARVSPEEIRILESLPFQEDNPDLPVSIVNYTIRSGRNTILNDARKSNPFSTDNYIAAHQPVSVLCTPIFSKNTMAGILYLENNAIQGAFTGERLKILNILISQAVVSIENTRLYNTLQSEKKQKKAAVGEINLQKKLIKNMSAELAMVEERERRAIADDLHDSVTQTLVLSLLNLKKMHSTLDTGKQELLGQVNDLIDQAIREIRSLTFQLSPKILYDFGLDAALEWLSDDMADRFGLKVVFSNQLKDDIRLSETANVTLFRAVRELLINIVKHAGTATAYVTLFFDAPFIGIRVKDRGKGFAQDMGIMPDKPQQGGFGLCSIHDRIHALNGLMTIQSVLEKGTEIEIKIPLNEHKGKSD